jgi:hypothetical protein
MITVKGDEIEFSSGRKMYANNGIVGISPNLEVFEGYDGDVYVMDNKGKYSHELTDKEAIELANYMLVLWSRFLWQHQVNAPTRPR